MQNLDRTETRRDAPLWHVELGVEGHAWRHAWRGCARDSIAAVDQARESLLGPVPGEAAAAIRVRVLECAAQVAA
jgi:hypothetical protein